MGDTKYEAKVPLIQKNVLGICFAFVVRNIMHLTKQKRLDEEILEIEAFMNEAVKSWRKNFRWNFLSMKSFRNPLKC